MIKSIELENFQSHKLTTLELDKGINAIIGSSDAGKSSIIRAIRWLMTNKPGGDSFRSYWGGDTRIILKLDDCNIVRAKSKSNLYAHSDDHNVAEYKAFGAGVPDEIIAALNMGSLNIQSQLDPPFLLSDSGGGVARYLNEIMNLDAIDIASKNIKHQTWGNSQEIGRAESSMSEITEQIKDLAWLKQAQRIRVGIAKDIERLDKINSDIDDIDSLVFDLNKNKAELSRLSDTVEASQMIDSVSESIESVTRLAKTASILSDLISSLDQSKRQLDVTERNITELESEIEEAMPDTCPLCGQTDFKMQFETLSDRL